MAAPAEFTGYTTNAKWTMNQKLSGDSDPILSEQGVGYLKRKAIGIATVSVTNSSFQSEGHTVVKSASSASGIPGAVEEIHLDGQPHKSDHSIYGKIITTASAKKPEEITDSFLTEGMLPESADAEGKLLHITSEADASAGNKLGWTAQVTSGYQNITVNGKTEKRWVRANSFKTAKGVEKKIKLIYDYVSSA